MTIPKNILKKDFSERGETSVKGVRLRKIRRTYHALDFDELAVGKHCKPLNFIKIGGKL